MEDLVRIKALEDELSAELEHAESAGKQSVQDVLTERGERIDKARKKARSKAKALIEGLRQDAEKEAEDILSHAEKDVQKLRSAYSSNREKALEYVLAELGV